MTRRRADTTTTIGDCGSKEGRVSQADVERIQHAFDAAIGGDVEPLVMSMAPDLEWRGVERGHLWWRAAPS